MQKILVVLLFVFCGVLAFGQSLPSQEAPPQVPQAQAQQGQVLPLTAFPELYKMQLRMNKSFYKVGEVPTYEILNAPANGFILWWGWKYDPPSGWFVSTGEIAAYYNQQTNGYWTGQDKPWGCKDMGFWVKIIQVLGSGNGISNPTATTFFAVNPGTDPGTECFAGAVGKQ